MTTGYSAYGRPFSILNLSVKSLISVILARYGLTVNLIAFFWNHSNVINIFCCGELISSTAMLLAAISGNANLQHTCLLI